MVVRVHLRLCMYVCVNWGHLLDVWGELASHRRSLTHHPSCQGWASRCLVLYIPSFVWVMVGYFTFLFLFFFFFFFCISMYT